MGLELRFMQQKPRNTELTTMYYGVYNLVLRSPTTCYAVLGTHMDSYYRITRGSNPITWGQNPVLRGSNCVFRCSTAVIGRYWQLNCDNLSWNTVLRSWQLRVTQLQPCNTVLMDLMDKGPTINVHPHFQKRRAHVSSNRYYVTAP